ncbi:retinol dehydrogenase 12-like [Macrobrachium rosenbergii]|uniref:retinol dehydrogenase 12-like n=1 Tax=Macrobrachium rosenbergii TaxID=79674 RepID=UPI0034D7AFDC
MDDLRFPVVNNNVDFGINFLPPLDEEVKEESWLVWILRVKIYVTVAATILLSSYALYVRYANRSSVVYCTSKEEMGGKTILVTANPTGIGLEAALDLARRGARVILACSEIKEAQVMAASSDVFKNGGVILLRKLNISSLREVRKFAADFLKTERRLDALLLAVNLGGSDTKHVTDEGLELTMAANHFGHFLLVNLLLDILKASAPSRVVIMASSAHSLLTSVNPKDLNFETIVYGALRAYAQSMGCNLLMANNLAYMMQGSGVTVNSMCPGMIQSQPYIRGNGLLTKIYLILLNVATRTAEEGAQTLIHLAVSEDGAKHTGAFFIDCKERHMTPLGKNNGLAKKIWERCEEIVGLNQRKDK